MNWTQLVRSSLAMGLAFLLAGLPGGAQNAPSEGGEWQRTSAPISKLLDYNDNFSSDGRFLIYDTRDRFGNGIGNGTTIMKVSVTTGLGNLGYTPDSGFGAQQAPDLGAASYSPVSGEVTSPGAFRSGSQRQEDTAFGERVGFSYDDFLLTQCGRTIGILLPQEMPPCGGFRGVALPLSVVRPAQSKSGCLERTAEDSWGAAEDFMRAFIGSVKEADRRAPTLNASGQLVKDAGGQDFQQIFLVDFPDTDNDSIAEGLQ